MKTGDFVLTPVGVGYIVSTTPFEGNKVVLANPIEESIIFVPADACLTINLETFVKYVRFEKQFEEM